MHSTALAQKTPCAPAEGTPFSAAFFQPYAAAVQAVFLLLCDLRAQLFRAGDRQSVRALTFRLKSPSSIAGKLIKKGLPVSIPAAHAALHDVGGLRVVLSSVPAVYRFARLLCASPAIEFVELRDYIAEPKKSGYRSLHVILRVPVRVHQRPILVPLEVQLRTPDMDAWAVAEHDLVYKPAGRFSPS